MTSKVHQRVELLTNITIIIVAVMFGYFLIQNFLSPKQPQPQPIKEIAKGTKINLADVDWQSNQKTILLVMQKGCHFCTESMPFYKTLIQKASEKSVKVVAVLPNSLEESNKYLKENGIQIQEIRQSSLGKIDVQGTPTLLLLNEKGEVSNSWVGKLPSEKEKEVISQL
jgi:thioredoxin-related protein